MKKTTPRLLSILLLVVYFSTTVPAQRQNYHVQGIVNSIRYPRFDLMTIFAHRGFFSNGSPENSLSAIQRAADYGIEGIELDIKLSKDGVPVLMHDYNIRRTTSSRLNTEVKNVTSQELRKLSLRDPAGNIISTQHVPTLAEALQFITDKGLDLVVALDLKDAAATKACWRVILNARNNHKGVPARKWVILKCKQEFYQTTAAMESSLGLKSGGLLPLYMSVYNTYCVDYSVSPLTHFNRFYKKAYFVGCEGEVKQEGGLLDDGYIDIAQWAGNVHDRTYTCAGFQAIPDHNRSDGTFYQNNGDCCYRLQDKFFVSQKGKGRDTRDDRGSLDFLRQFHNMIITDDPLAAVDFAKRHNQRNISYYYNANARLEDTLTISKPAEQEEPEVLEEEKPAELELTTDSSIAPVATITSKDFFVYPNPARSWVKVHLVQPQTGPVTFQLFNLSGKRLLNQQQNVSQGIQDITLPLHSGIIGKGIYLLQVIYGNQHLKQSCKLVIE